MIVDIKMDDIVLLKNNKQFDWKGGKFPQKWGQSLHFYEYLWKRSCDFNKGIGSTF